MAAKVTVFANGKARQVDPEKTVAEMVRDLKLTPAAVLVERNGRLHTGRLQFLLVARIFDALRWLILGPRYAAALRQPPGAMVNARDHDS